MRNELSANNNNTTKNGHIEVIKILLLDPRVGLSASNNDVIRIAIKLLPINNLMCLIQCMI